MGQLFALTELCAREIVGREEIPELGTRLRESDVSETVLRDVDITGLRPKNSLLVLLQVSPDGTGVARFTREGCTQDFVVKSWLSATGLPTDSVFACVLYVDTGMHVCLGLFDVLRLQGDASVADEGPLQRHTRVAEIVRQCAPREPATGCGLRHHWAGFWGSCARLVRETPQLPFELDLDRPFMKLPESAAGEEYTVL
jgi:hypothetical protein